MASRYGLEVRAVTASDAPGLGELLTSAGLAVAPRVVAERLEAMRHEPGAILLALEWGPPSGVVVISWGRSLLADTPTARITTLLVGPDARRRGVGRLLLKAASQAARAAGCSALRLEASSDQADMAGFCLATGFSKAGGVFERGLRKRV